MSTIEAFARELERHVQAALERGVVISASGKDLACPLGCVDGAPRQRPVPASVPVLAGEQPDDRRQFAVGFEGGVFVRNGGGAPFFELGREYARRFP